MTENLHHCLDFSCWASENTDDFTKQYSSDCSPPHRTALSCASYAETQSSLLPPTVRHSGWRVASADSFDLRPRATKQTLCVCVCVCVCVCFYLKKSQNCKVSSGSKLKKIASEEFREDLWKTLISDYPGGSKEGLLTVAGDLKETHTHTHTHIKFWHLKNKTYFGKRSHLSV